MAELKSVQEIVNASYNADVKTQVTIPAFSYTNIAASAQTVVKTGAGVLGVVSLNNNLVSGIKAYDNTVSGGSVLFALPAGASAGAYQYNVKFATGLVVSSGAAADSLTIMYL